MEEFIFPAWTIPTGVAFITLGFGALQLMGSSDEVMIAKGCFLIAAIIFAAQAFVWGTTTPHGVGLRVIVCLMLFGALGWLSIEAFRYVDRRSATVAEAIQTTERLVPSRAETLEADTSAYAEVGKDGTIVFTDNFDEYGLSAEKIEFGGYPAYTLTFKNRQFGSGLSHKKVLRRT